MTKDVKKLRHIYLVTYRVVAVDEADAKIQVTCNEYDRVMVVKE